LAEAIADHLQLKQRRGGLTEDEARLRELFGSEASGPLAEAARPG
jgi:hypothetical protein